MFKDEGAILQAAATLAAAEIAGRHARAGTDRARGLPAFAPRSSADTLLDVLAGMARVGLIDRELLPLANKPGNDGSRPASGDAPSGSGEAE